MNLFDDDRYSFRETYFVYFDTPQRPKLPAFKRALLSRAPFLQIAESRAESDDRLVSMQIVSYDDHAAVELVYQEGNDVLDEIRSLAQTLQKDALREEMDKLQKIVQYKSRFRVHHFEQSAGTAAFNAVKMPVLKFAKQSTAAADGRDMFSKALDAHRKEPKFFFDPVTYTQPEAERTDTLDVVDAETAESSVYDRVNPDTLVTVIEVLSHLCKGISLDPATGILM
ncbi:MAG: hypothetical protein LBT46_08265 [Planctomycetaceae bacterium]|jgi:hypothetical protein|nr:hypothetical protein [Planctomycetaceae bacterium]